MAGEMTEEFGLLSDNAGIIPRTPYTLFDKLKGRDSTVKCSFIELYNEDLRDLLSDDEEMNYNCLKASGMASLTAIYRPQMNTPVPKDTLLSELASEIENLKRNLIATRHRNGVYMTSDAHEEMTKENESQRIINQKQKQRIEALELNLHDKAEELFELKRQLQQLLADNKEAHVEIGRMRDTLHKAEHTWDMSVARVSDVIERLQTRMKNFQAQQTGLLRDFSTNLS
ncbi:hypothetical protein APSETT444_006492 [Aspergillus pseudonomiae]